MPDQPITGKSRFRRIAEVEPSCADQVLAIEETFHQAIDPAAGAFDFGNVRKAASTLPATSLVKIVPAFGLQETTPVSVMVLSLKESVRQALSRPFTNPAFWDKVEHALTRAFTGLDEQDDAPHFAFRQDGGDGSTSYFYNLLFALQDEETEGFLYAMAFCIDVTFALERSKVRSLNVGDTAPYTIRLNAMTVRQDLRSAA
ncbi:Type-2Aa cytolytic delta-endotoxin [Streptomyces sp. NPDC059909]|uniref:Type-2Aa cytolytic delta-endotoxin n=1 Tax=Streptomyces sp. NPDC059909 TaxID=3346998 RepID=UPI0036549B87